MPKLPLPEARRLVQESLTRAGLASEHAGAMTEIILRADLMGHRTHGFAMLNTYIDRIQSGLIRSDGEIETLNETPATFAWRCERLPGAWVMGRALEKLTEMSRTQPVVTATVANCTHIGSLSAYLEEPARAGRLVLMMATDPGVASVAPFGGADPILTTDPIACGIPTGGDPILIDQCTSLVSNSQAQSIPPGETELPGDWLLDNQGRVSRDPAVLRTDPPGTIMPLGGADFGYKGFGFMLMCEAYSLALSGHGRSTPKTRGAQGVFIQMLDPAAFSGAAAFLRETEDLARRCRDSRPAAGSPGVRLPGERALALKRQQSEHGIEIAERVWDALTKRWNSMGILPPAVLL